MLQETKSTDSSLKRVLIIVIIIVVGLIGVFIYNQIKVQQNQQAIQNINTIQQDAKTAIRNNITSYVILQSSEFITRPIGGISGLSISVTNNTAYIIDNVKVQVNYIKTDGGVWETKYMDFALIPPNSKLTLKAPDSGRGTSVTDGIVSIKSNALGIY
jgi:type II secretory pathway pseudopilin PulG